MCGVCATIENSGIRAFALECLCYTVGAAVSADQNAEACHIRGFLPQPLQDLVIAQIRVIGVQHDSIESCIAERCSHIQYPQRHRKTSNTKPEPATNEVQPATVNPWNNKGKLRAVQCLAQFLGEWGFGERSQRHSNRYFPFAVNLKTIQVRGGPYFNLAPPHPRLAPGRISWPRGAVSVLSRARGPPQRELGPLEAARGRTPGPSDRLGFARDGAEPFAQLKKRVGDQLLGHRPSVIESERWENLELSECFAHKQPGCSAANSALPETPHRFVSDRVRRLGFDRPRSDPCGSRHAAILRHLRRRANICACPLSSIPPSGGPWRSMASGAIIAGFPVGNSP